MVPVHLTFRTRTPDPHNSPATHKRPGYLIQHPVGTGQGSEYSQLPRTIVWVYVCKYYHVRINMRCPLLPVLQSLPRPYPSLLPRAGIRALRAGSNQTGYSAG